MPRSSRPVSSSATGAPRLSLVSRNTSTVSATAAAAASGHRPVRTYPAQAGRREQDEDDDAETLLGLRAVEGGHAAQ